MSGVLPVITSKGIIAYTYLELLAVIFPFFQADDMPVKSIENQYASIAIMAKWFSMLLKNYVSLRSS